MNQLRDFAGSEEEQSSETIQGYSKEGKSVTVTKHESLIQRWGIWADATGYFNGKHVGEGSIGIDYRVKPHWLIGAYASYWNADRSFWSGGLYTAFYVKNWWAVLGGQLGPNDYTAWAGAGYDFHKGHWIFGPVVSLQYDDITVDRGFGSGQLIQPRVGGRVAYAWGPVVLSLQVMYEYRGIDSGSGSENGIWAGAGASYAITQDFSVFTGYAIDANENFQEHQVDLGCRFQF